VFYSNTQPTAAGDLTPRRRHIGQSSYQYSLSAVAVQVVEIWRQLPNKWRMPTSPAPENDINAKKQCVQQGNNQKSNAII